MPALIEVDDVRKTHRMGAREVHALAGISLCVARGDYLALMGASGSGKTTLLHLIGCLDRPSSGQIRLDGTDLSDLDDDERIKPGLSTTVDFLVSEHAGALYLPLSAVFMDELDRTVVYVKSARGTEERLVELGGSTDRIAIVEKGLAEGDEVLLVQPEQS